MKKIYKDQKKTLGVIIFNTLLLIVYLSTLLQLEDRYVCKGNHCVNNGFENFILDYSGLILLIISIIYFISYIVYNKRTKWEKFLAFLGSFLLFVILNIIVVFFDNRPVFFAKPAIYIYPTETIEASVNLKIKGQLTKVIPEYNNGWNVKVKPNGQMKVIGGNSQITYDYLFYENTVDKVIEPKEGWMVDKKDLKKWFNKNLYKLGLNKNEADEFIDYWIPKLNKGIDKKYISIKLLSEEYLSEYMNLKIAPKPDKLLRLEFLLGYN